MVSVSEEDGILTSSSLSTYLKFYEDSMFPKGKERSLSFNIPFHEDFTYLGKY